MYADISRDGFDPDRNDQRIVVAQRNLVTDADWNEQFAIEANRLRDLARDLHGRHWGPGTESFRIVPKKDGDGKDALYLTKGRYYVDGLPCVNPAESMLLTKQPNYSDAPDPIAGAAGTTKLLYLEVRTRHVTAFEAARLDKDRTPPATAQSGKDRPPPATFDPALTRFDSTSRLRTVWQVKWIDLGTGHRFEKTAKSPGKITKGEYDEFLKALNEKKNVPEDGTRGRMAARAGSEDPNGVTCSGETQGGYSRDANTLFRVEIHEVDKEKKLFKWARDNASAFFPIRNDAKGVGSGADRSWTLELDTLGRDVRSALKPGDWVEVIDDAYSLSAPGHEEPRPLLQVDRVDPHAVTVTIRPPSKPDGEPPKDRGLPPLKRPYLRRWGSGLRAVTQGWQELADGIEVMFSESDNLRRGDTWLIPARSAIAGILWPRDDVGSPAAVPPVNGLPSYAPLALLGPGPSLIDLRRIFDSDSDVPRSEYPAAASRGT